MAPRTLALVALAIAAVVHVAAAQVTDGCSVGTDTTAANGWFTLDGACFGALELEASQGACSQLCPTVGLECETKPQRLESDCEALLLAYAASDAAFADMPASPAKDPTVNLCMLWRSSASDQWVRRVHETYMPWNSGGCHSFFTTTGTEAAVLMCECHLADTTAPALSSVTGTQASTSTVTVTGTTDEAGTVYCAVGSSVPPASSAVKSSGQSTAVGSAGSFSVTVTGVSGEGSKHAYCVGEDAAGNVGGTPAGSPSFHFDQTGPTVSGIAGSGDGNGIVTITGASDDAGTVKCMVDTPGQSKSAASVAGGSDTLESAGAFSVITSGAYQNTDSVYCVGQDSVGNYGTVVEAPLNQPPTDIALSSDTVAENSGEGTDIGTLTTTDPDAGDSFTYTIESQSVTNAFKVSGDKLQVGSGTVDFEATPSISVTVRSSDGTASTDIAFTITVTDVNEAPTGIAVSSDTVAENSAEGTDVGTLTTTDPDAGDAFTYTIESQTVTNAFKVSGDKLQVGSGTMDFEATPSISVTVRATDSGSLTLDKTFTITVTGVNEAPTDVTLSSDTVAENAAEGSDVGTLSTTDPDAGDSFTYTIESQSVTDAFKISGDTLQVGSGTVDFEATPSITVTVRATDSGSLTFDKTLTITVTDVNEAPTQVTVTGDTFTEKSDEGTDVGTLAATDPDAGDTTFTFTIESQAVTDAFKISGDKLQLGPAGPRLAKDTVVSVTVAATDAGGLSVSHSVDVTVTEDSANLALLGIITAGLTVVAGFAFAFYRHGSPSAGVDGVTDGDGSQA